MRYFVTGATGFLGSELARQLGAAGHEVHALVRQPGKALELREQGVRLFEGDVTDKESLRPGMQGTDGVFHVAGWYKVGVRDRGDGERVNIHGTRNVLELMGELGIPKGVYTSTLAVNSDTHGRVVDESYRFPGRTYLSEYDRTKAAAHDIALDMIANGLPLVVAMPGMIYGPGDSSSMGAMFRSYLKRSLPVIPRGLAFAWAHVQDVAHGHLLAMERGRPRETYILAGQPATVAEVLQMAEEITGVPRPPLVPAWTLRALSPLMGIIEKLAPLPATFTAEGLRVSAGVTYLGDNGKARRELGYEPRPLREGLEQYLKQEMGSG
jgi:nucleoside-diphosphate-sugar epimerase